MAFEFITGHPAFQAREFSQRGSTGARDQVALVALAALHLYELLGDLHRGKAIARMLQSRGPTG
jgi:hypothetical protein